MMYESGGGTGCVWIWAVQHSPSTAILCPMPIGDPSRHVTLVQIHADSTGGGEPSQRGDVSQTASRRHDGQPSQHGHEGSATNARRRPPDDPPCPRPLRASALILDDRNRPLADVNLGVGERHVHAVEEVVAAAIRLAVRDRELIRTPLAGSTTARFDVRCGDGRR